MFKRLMYGEAEASPGEWFEFQAAEDGQPAIELRIRHVPPAERKRILLKHHGRKNRFRIGDFLESESDKLANEAAQIEIATYCLVDSKGFTFRAAPTIAERLGLLLGQKIDPAEPITLDGRWTDQLKEAVFRGTYGPELMAFIDEKVTKLVELRKAEAEEASGN